MILWEMRGQRAGLHPQNPAIYCQSLGSPAEETGWLGLLQRFPFCQSQVVHHGLPEPQGVWEVPLVSHAQGSGAFQGSSLSVNVPVRAVSTLPFRICDT